MAGTKISNLPVATTPLNGTELLPLVQSGVTSQTTLANINTVTATNSTAPRALKDRFADTTNVKDFGAVGDGITNDTQAFLNAAAVSSKLFVPSGSYLVTVTPSNAAGLLSALDGLHPDADLTLNFASGVYNLASSLAIRPQNGGRITIKGATPISTSISAGTPSVVAVLVSGNRYTYSITFQVTSTAGFAAGDWVIAEPTGTNLTYLSYDETAAGVRYKEYAGAAEVISVGSNTITVKCQSRQSSNQFPGGGTVAASSVSGGTITKLPTVFKFASVSGVMVSSSCGTIQDIAIVGNNAGSGTVGIDTNSTTTANGLQTKALGLYNVIVSNFTTIGVSVAGASSSLTGDRVFVSGCGTHGVRAGSGSAISLTNSGVSGCGDTAGNGFFALEGGVISCPSSFAVGVRNSGYYANRGGTIYAENCLSVNNGNYADEVAGGWVDSEGKGFEAESNGTLYCNNSVAIFMTSIGFYCNSASLMCCFRAVSSAHLHLHGFYALLSGSISTRYSVSRNCGGRGFYAYVNSRIDANNTYASGNDTYDYVAQGGSQITAKGYLNTGSKFNVNIDQSGVNQIITSDAFEIGTKLILAKGANLTIASGVITVTSSYHVVDTEGAAATDDLDTINGGADGFILVMRALSSARDIVVKSGTGNITLSGGADRTLSNLADRLTLMYDGVANRWYEISFADNAA